MQLATLTAYTLHPKHHIHILEHPFHSTHDIHTTCVQLDTICIYSPAYKIKYIPVSIRYISTYDLIYQAAFSSNHHHPLPLSAPFPQLFYHHPLHLHHLFSLPRQPHQQ